MDVSISYQRQCSIEDNNKYKCYCLVTSNRILKESFSCTKIMGSRIYRSGKRVAADFGFTSSKGSPPIVRITMVCFFKFCGFYKSCYFWGFLGKETVFKSLAWISYVETASFSNFEYVTFQNSPTYESFTRYKNIWNWTRIMSSNSSWSIDKIIIKTCHSEGVSILGYSCCI